VRHSFSKVDNQILCVLHLHKRVIEKVITLFFLYVDELEKEEKKVRVKHIDYLSLCVNTLALGSELKPSLAIVSALLKTKVKLGIPVLQIFKQRMWN
jgi:hypothetical protein